MRLPRRPAGIDHCNPSMLPCGDRQISFVHAGKERPRFLLEAVFIAVPAARALRRPLVPPPRPAHTRPRVGIQ